jgi:hypothetical protein
VPPLNISKPCSFHQLTLNREPWNFEPEQLLKNHLNTSIAIFI